MSQHKSNFSGREPPDPCYVLRSGSEYESAVNHISIQTFSSCTYLLTCDQMGFIDFWHLQARRNCVHFSIRNYSEAAESSKQNGLIWVEILPKINIEGLLVVQSRNGVLHFLTVSKLLTTVNSDDIRKLCSIETNFTAFCKCDALLVISGTYLAVPFDNFGESSFRVLFFGKSESLTPEHVLKMGSIVKCCPSEGLPMCAKLFELSGQITLLVGYESGNVILYSTETEAALNKIRLHSAGTETTSPVPLTCFAFNSDFSMLMVGTASPTVFCVKLEITTDFEKLQSSDAEETNRTSKVNVLNLSLWKQLDLNESCKGVSCVEFRPDDKLFACATWDCNVRYFSGSKKNKPLAVLDWHHSTVTSLKFHNNLLFSACKEGKIVCWDLYA